MSELTQKQQLDLEKLRRAVGAIESGTEQEPVDSSDGLMSEAPTPVESSGSRPSVNEQYTAARAVVLRKLTASAKTRHQLAEALREKEFSEQIIGDVLDRMEQVHLLDDAGFAQAWVRTRHESKKLGASALRRELQLKGVADELIEDALEQLSTQDEQEAAQELIEAKLRGVEMPAGYGAEERKERDKITRRLVNMLARRGHNPGAAMSIVRAELDARMS